MKLYTEEQITNAVMFGRWGGTMKKDYQEFLNKLKPIELPTEEEIRLKALDVKSNINKLLFHDDSFQFGAHWVIEQIKNQNK